MLKYENEYLLGIGCVASRRIVSLYKELDSEVCHNIITSLLFLDQKPSQIILLINSPGGQDELCYAIYDTIKACKSYIVGIVLGRGYSSSSIILQACDLRVMSRNSLLLLHDGNVSLSRDSRPQFDSDVKCWNLLYEKMYSAYEEKSNLTKVKIKKLCTKDTYLEPEKALEFKLIDKIMEQWNEIL